MHIDGTTQTMTSLDPETESILLRRLHPRINNFNDVVIFLMECNMDIKYVGSGEAAKALVFYITDYITKSSLATHVGLGALSYAIKWNEEKFNEMPVSQAVQNRSLFNKTVNAMMARHETSHQQILSYMIGGGDHYKFNNFRILKWGEFDCFMGPDDAENNHIEANGSLDASDNIENVETPHSQNLDEPPETVSDILRHSSIERNSAENWEGHDDVPEVEDDDDDPCVPSEKTVVVSVQEGDVTGLNDVLDYRYQSTEPMFDALCPLQDTQTPLQLVVT
jgi:hypothetical protein